MAKDNDAEPNEDGELEDDELTEGLEKKRFSGKKILMIAAPVVLLLIAGGVYFAFFSGGGEETAGHAEEADAAPPDVVFYDLPEMLVNLNTGGGKASYLKIRVALEVEGKKTIAELEDQLPRIIDNFQIYLRELRLEDLNGSAGMFRLKEELLARVNTALAPIRVNDVLFKEMLVQ